MKPAIDLFLPDECFNYQTMIRYERLFYLQSRLDRVIVKLLIYAIKRHH